MSVIILKDNKKNKFIYILLISLISFFMIVLFILSFFQTSKDVVVSSASNVDYSVYLADNSFYEKKFLPANMEYVASLIKYIDVNVAYDINASDLLDYDYSYYIEAIVRVYGDGLTDNVLFEKRKILKDKQLFSGSDSDKLSIKENFKIDYNEYNKLVASFKTSYLLNSSSDVQIVLHVNANVKSKDLDKSIAIAEDTTLLIPLTEQTINIKITDKPSNTYNVLSGSNKDIIKNKTVFIGSIILLLVDIVVIYLFAKTFTNKGEKHIRSYKKMLAKILREYDLIIANINDEIDEKDYEVINVTSFNELRDIHDNIGSPILFKEITKNKVSSFVIISDNLLYKYVLKSIDLKKKKK